jgi:hypothetical protein
MTKDARYHAFVCMDRGCTGRCVAFVSDEGRDYCEEPCACLSGGTNTSWKKLEDYFEEMKKLKKAIDTASNAIENIVSLKGE